MSEWEKIEDGFIETWKKKVMGGYLFRVDHYNIDQPGHIVATTMCFVPYAKS